MGSGILICSTSWFPWCQYSHRGLFRTTTVTSLSTGLERDGVHQEPCEGLQHISWLWHSNHQMCPDVIFFFFFLSVISLCWGKDYSLAVGSKGYSLVAVHRLLAAMAPFVENGLSVTRASVIAAPGLQSPSSVVVAKGLRCFTACEIFLDQGLNLCLLHWQVDSLPLSHQGSP